MMDQEYRRPLWRLPAGVSPGTWEYTRRESIAVDYAGFIAGTPLIALDLQLLLRYLPQAKPDRSTRVVDLGCGDGRALRWLWQRGFDVLGIDLSQPMLDVVVGRDLGEQLSQRLIRANLVELSGVRDGIADHAICLFSTIGMIRGRSHRRSFLQHAARLVKPGGTLVLHVHNRNAAWRDRPSTAAYLKSAWQSLRAHDCEWGDRVYAYRGLADMYLHTFSRGELRRDLSACGWCIDQILPLSPNGDGELPSRYLFPSLRAGGFIAVGRRHG